MQISSNVVNGPKSNN